MSVVYFIEAVYNRLLNPEWFADRRGPIKIGWTTGDPRARLSHLQTGSFLTLHLLGTIPGGRDLERELHEIFLWSRCGRGNEWYWANDDLLAIAEGGASVVQIQERYAINPGLVSVAQ